MSSKLQERILTDLLAIEKESNVSPSEFVSELGTAFLNICGWVCEALGLTEEERNSFFDGLVNELRRSIEDTRRRRREEQNGTI